jgi:outer membrane protein
MKKGLILAFIALVAWMNQAFAQHHGDIALANVDSIVVSLPEFKNQQKLLETYAKQLQTTLEAKGKELQTKIGDYQANANGWIPEVIKEKEKEIQRLQEEYQEFQQTSQNNLNRKEQEVFAPLFDKAQKGIEALAKEKGYKFVFPSNVALYAVTGHDITNDVIIKLGGKVGTAGGK